MDRRVSVGEADFDLSAEVASLYRDDPGVGAVASFVGTVRAREQPVADAVHAAGAASVDVTTLELEHYPGMTEKAIGGMIDEAFQRFSIRAVKVIHRVGRLAVGEQIVMVAVSSAHRGQAFQACEFLMDYLKTQAPFWKKEHTADGESRWVDARVADDDALRRWGLDVPNAG